MMNEYDDMDVAAFLRRDAPHKADAKFMEVTITKLADVASDVISLVLEKNEDYGDAWQKQSIIGVLVRLADKLYRIETLADGREALVAGEDIEESLIDAIGYSMLGLLYLDHQRNLEQLRKR